MSLVYTAADSTAKDDKQEYRKIYEVVYTTSSLEGSTAGPVHEPVMGFCSIANNTVILIFLLNYSPSIDRAPTKKTPTT